jgi:DNA-binding response OmpR family regulator
MAEDFLGTVVVGLDGDRRPGLFDEFVHRGFAPRRCGSLRTLRLCPAGERRAATVVFDDLPDATLAKSCRELRKSFPDSGLILVGVRENDQEVKLLDLGADDVLRKDAEVGVIAARLANVVRRRCALTAASASTRVAETILTGVSAHAHIIRPQHQSVAAVPLQDVIVLKTTQGSITLDHRHVSAMVAGKDVGLTLAEFSILAKLASKPSHLFTRGELFSAFGHSLDSVSHRSLDSHVCSLRRKLGAAGKGIVTQRGLGYRLDVA